MVRLHIRGRVGDADTRSGSSQSSPPLGRLCVAYPYVPASTLGCVVVVCVVAVVVGGGGVVVVVVVVVVLVLIVVGRCRCRSRSRRRSRFMAC